MAQELRTFQVTTPAGTLQAAPQVTPLTVPPRIVREVEFLVPPGPNGVLGFALGAAGQIVVPYNPNSWIVASDETVKFPLDDQIDSGAWQFFSYNIGTYAHTVYIRMLLDLVSAGALATPSPIPLDSLSAAPVAPALTLLDGGAA